MQKEIFGSAAVKSVEPMLGKLSQQFTLLPPSRVFSHLDFLSE